MTNRGDVTNSLPTFYLAAPSTAPNAAIRPATGLQMNASPYMVPAQHHHQPLGPAFSLQPYAAYPHGVIYQPVVVPPMALFQPSLGMMMSASPSLTTQPQQISRGRHVPLHDVRQHSTLFIDVSFSQRFNESLFILLIVSN